MVQVALLVVLLVVLVLPLVLWAVVFLVLALDTAWVATKKREKNKKLKMFL